MKYDKFVRNSSKFVYFLQILLKIYEIHEVEGIFNMHFIWIRPIFLGSWESYALSIYWVVAVEWIFFNCEIVHLKVKFSNF